MTRLALLLALLLATWTIGCTSEGAETTNPNTPPDASTVVLSGDQFHPATFQAKVGQTVHFLNRDKVGHTVTADDGTFDSGMFGNGASWTHTFTAPGTYRYHCIPHAMKNDAGQWDGMVGVVVVT